MELSDRIKNTHKPLESDLGTVLGNKHMIKTSGNQKQKGWKWQRTKYEIKQKERRGDRDFLPVMLKPW